jgi:hypothetical protein
MVPHASQVAEQPVQHQAHVADERPPVVVQPSVAELPPVTEQPLVAERTAAPIAQPVKTAPAPVQPGIPEALSTSGLILIETDPIKRATVASAPTAEATPPAPRRRSRPREVYNMESSEPLVQIETQHTPN